MRGGLKWSGMGGVNSTIACVYWSYLRWTWRKST